MLDFNSWQRHKRIIAEDVAQLVFNRLDADIRQRVADEIAENSDSDDSRAHSCPYFDRTLYYFQRDDIYTKSAIRHFTQVLAAEPYFDGDFHSSNCQFQCPCHLWSVSPNFCFP
jgi:hypothetical protein